MSRVPGEVDVTQYPLFDTHMSGVGISGLSQQTNLFAGNNIGRPQFTNMQQASQIPSGGIFLITSLRCQLLFLSLASPEYTAAYGSLPALAAAPTSSPARMLDCYNHYLYGSQVTLFIAQKPMIIVHSHYLPAGGGLFGQTNVAGASVVSNGLPSREAVGMFAKPLKISSLQAFTVQVNFYDWTQNSVAGGFTGNSQGGALTGGISPVNFINQADGLKFGVFTLSGHISRDIN